MKKIITHIRENASKPRLITAAGCSLALTAFCGIFPVVFVRNIGLLIRTLGKTFGLRSYQIKQFAEIFDQLKEASILPPVVILAAVFLACALTVLLLPNSRKARILAIIIWALLLLPLAILSLWFTLVNDLQFGIVIGSLIRMAAAGAF